MKKLIALLLCLMLCLPVVALGEAASNPDVYTVDLGDFTITLNAADILQKGEKAEGSIMFLLFPAYDETNTFHNNLNCSWTAADLSNLEGYDAQTYGELVLKQAISQLESQGIAASNAQLLTAEHDDETGSTTLITSMGMDYSGAGIDLQMTLFQIQIYVPAGEDGTYLFTISADTLDNAASLLTYLDQIEFPEE